MFPLFTTRFLHVRHDVRDPSCGSGDCGRECCPVILPKCRLPLRRKAGWGFFSPLKNPTASAGFEPANLGTKGQHATPRPPKPLKVIYWILNSLCSVRCFCLDVRLITCICWAKFVTNTAAGGTAYGNFGVRKTMAVLNDNKTRTALH